MSFRSRISLALGVAFLCAVAGALLISRPASAQGDIHVFVGPGGRLNVLDFEQSGLRLGDRLTFRAPLLDGTQTSDAGETYGECVVVRRITDDADGPGGIYRCNYLLRLADGDLIVDGLDPHGPGVASFVVLGGTGAYAGATGEATVTDSDAGTEFVIALTG